MLFKGERKMLKEPEVVAFQCVVAKSILGQDNFAEHNEKDVVVEVWLNTDLKWNEIKEAIRYLKTKQYFQEIEAKQQNERYNKTLEESRKEKLDYVR